MVKVRFLTKMLSFWKLMLLSIDIVGDKKIILTSTGSFFVIEALVSEYIHMSIYTYIEYVYIFIYTYILWIYVCI